MTNALYLALATIAAAQTNTAVLTGTVHDESGAPVQAHLSLITSGSTQHQFTARNGGFLFIALPPGSHLLCGQILPTGAQKEDPALNSCDWMEPSSIMKFTLAKGEHKTDVRLTLKRGRLITVRVNDPGKLLPPKLGQNSGPELSVLISCSSGIVRRMPVLNEDATGRNHAIVVAYDTPHKLFIQSNSFALKDENSNDHDGNTPVNIQVGHGDPDFKVVVNVAGKGK